MAFRIGLAFSLEEGELMKKLEEVMELQREHRMLNRVPESLSIIERLSRGMEISQREISMCNKEEFTEDIISAAWDVLNKEQLETVEVAMAMFRETIKEQFTADRRVVLMFRQYIEIGGEY